MTTDHLMGVAFCVLAVVVIVVCAVILLRAA